MRKMRKRRKRGEGESGSAAGEEIGGETKFSNCLENIEAKCRGRKRKG